jgi:hypothetical protein
LIRDAELDDASTRREIVESMALQSMARWPAVAHELGITADYWRTQKNRQLMAEAILTAKFLKADGSVPILTTAASAGLSQEWAAMQFAAVIYDPAKGREWLRDLAILEQALRLRLRVENVFRNSRPEELEDALMSALQTHQQAHRGGGSELPSMREVSLAYIEDQGRRSAEKDHPTLTLGPSYPHLTEILRGGWKRGEATALVGGAGAGKTSMAEDFRRQLGLQGIYTLMFSGEMTEEQLAERFVHAECGQPLSRTLNALDLAQAAERIAQGGASRFMLVDEQPTLQVSRMLSTIRSAEARYGSLGLVVVDHVAKVRKPGRDEERQDWERIAEAAVRIKELAKTAKVPVLLLAHMTTQDGAQEDANFEPTQASIRGGGKLINEVDNAIALWRVKEKTFIKVLKARQNGEARGRKFQMRYYPNVQTFAEMSGA